MASMERATLFEKIENELRIGQLYNRELVKFWREELNKLPALSDLDAANVGLVAANVDLVRAQTARELAAAHEHSTRAELLRERELVILGKIQAGDGAILKMLLHSKSHSEASSAKASGTTSRTSGKSTPKVGKLPPPQPLPPPQSATLSLNYASLQAGAPFPPDSSSYEEFEKYKKILHRLAKGYQFSYQNGKCFVMAGASPIMSFPSSADNLRSCAFLFVPGAGYEGVLKEPAPTLPYCADIASPPEFKL